VMGFFITENHEERNVQAPGPNVDMKKALDFGLSSLSLVLLLRAKLSQCA